MTHWNPLKALKNLTMLTLWIICFAVFSHILGIAIDRNIEIQNQQAMAWMEEYNLTFYYEIND